MARIVNEKEYAERRNEILDIAQRLVYTKGYEQMSIQDILDSLHISKGAFYHYFDSKPSLLEALIERMAEEGKQLILSVLDAPDQTALEKIKNYFDTASRWKISRKTFLLAILKVWYADDNAIVRQKLVQETSKWVTPGLTAIIYQGVKEGVFSVEYPERLGEVMFTLLQTLADGIALMILSNDPLPDIIDRMESRVKVYTDALERILGAPSGSLFLIDIASLAEWLVLPEAQT